MFAINVRRCWQGGSLREALSVCGLFTVLHLNDIVNREVTVKHFCPLNMFTALSSVEMNWDVSLPPTYLEVNVCKYFQYH